MLVFISRTPTWLLETLVLLLFLKIDLNSSVRSCDSVDVRVDFSLMVRVSTVVTSATMHPWGSFTLFGCFRC